MKRFSDLPVGALFDHDGSGYVWRKVPLEPADSTNAILLKVGSFGGGRTGRRNHFPSGYSVYIELSEELVLAARKNALEHLEYEATTRRRLSVKQLLAMARDMGLEPETTT
jgi:hypothetical protein